MWQLQLAFLLAILCVAGLAAMGCRPYLDEFQSPWRRLVAAALFVAILTLAVFLPVASYGGVGELSLAELTVPDMLVGHVILIVFLASWWVLRGDITMARFLHLSSDDLGAKITQGLAAGCNGWIITIVVMITAVTLFGGTSGPADATKVPEVMPWIAKLPFLNKLAIVVAAMTIEEAFFRGFLQPRVGLLTSSLLFALGHFSYGMPFMIVGVLTISLVIGRTFAQRGDLLPCMLAHGVFDAVQIFVVLPYAVEMLEQTAAVPG